MLNTYYLLFFTIGVVTGFSVAVALFAVAAAKPPCNHELGTVYLGGTVTTVYEADLCTSGADLDASTWQPHAFCPLCGVAVSSDEYFIRTLAFFNGEGVV